MSALQIVFLLIALLTLFSASMVVFARKTIHSAFWLILALFGVAATFATLEASFFAVIQVAVYIGAIAILIIFAVMLTRRSMEETGDQLLPGWGWAALVVLIVFGGIIYLLLQWQGVFQAPQVLTAGGENLEALGMALVMPDRYVIPFEVASVLLVAAMIGAIYVAGDLKKRS